MNKRKTAGNIIDVFVYYGSIIILFNVFSNIVLKIISLFILKKEIIFNILLIIYIILGNLGAIIIIKKEKTYGKFIAKRLVKDEKELVTLKDAILTFLILSILSIIWR